MRTGIRLGLLAAGLRRLVGLGIALGVAACATPGVKQATPPATAQTPPPSPFALDVRQAIYLDLLPPVPVPRVAHPPIDRSGRKQVGRASFYARHFDGRKMADGRRFEPYANVAASKTLPLGTVAKVTDLESGMSAVVKVEDRGPHVAGRVLDVSPKVADALQMKHTGTAPVVVKPIAVPQPDGGVKLGAGAAELPPEQVQNALQTAQGAVED